MRAVVTGARGFVGPFLVAHLEECGDAVVGLDRLGPDAIDILDADALRERFIRAHPDVVYHLAALSHVGESWDDPASTFRVNAEGTLQVLTAAAQAGRPRVIVVGTAEEYGTIRPDEVPVSEDLALRPVTPYGAAKASAEMLALQAHLGGGLDTVRVRAFNHTGPGQSPRFLVPALAQRVVEAERDGDGYVAIGNTDPVRDVTDVRDVVRAYRLLAEHGTAGEVYNVCSGTGTSVGAIADALLAQAVRPLTLRPDPALARPVDVPRLVGDNRRLRDATGWAPRIPLSTTLGDVLTAARARPTPDGT